MELNTKKPRELLKNFDFFLFGVVILTAVFGVIVISSAGGENAERYVLVQSVSLVLGVAGIVFLMIVDYEYLAKIWVYLYIASIVLLVLVLIPGIGSWENGARSWFRFGRLIGIQPAELVKLAFIVTFARHLASVEDQLNRPRNVALLTAHMGVLVGLILLQPDVGTAVVFFCIFAAMLFVAKISWKYIVGGIGAVAVAFPIVWFFFLKPYQKNRIINVFNPENDPTNSGYHVMQSKIAAGSGRIFGSGLYHGNSQFNNFLPERHTDFIYSVVCEELGIIGAIAVIVLLIIIIARCLYIAKNARNSLGTYICTGVAAMLIFQSFENIGMCIGIMPVTGITLPFFSYGGSSILTTMLAMGLVLNVQYRHKVINF